MKNKIHNRLQILSAVALGLMFGMAIGTATESSTFGLIAFIALSTGPFWSKFIPGIRFGVIGNLIISEEEKLLEKVKAKGVEAATEEYKRLLEKSIFMTPDAYEKQMGLFLEKHKGINELDNITETLKSIGEQLKALKELGAGEKASDLDSQIKSWQESNSAALKSIKAGQKADLSAIELKLNSPMLPSNTYNGSAYLPQPEFQAGATEIVRLQPTFWDYLKKGFTSAAAYVWVNKKNPEGAAGFIGPGVAKPGISFEIATEISNAKKVAVSEKVATELLEDIPGMRSWILQEMAYQLKQKINTTLMTGVASSTVPAGIQTISVTYSLTTIATTNPNNWDAIRAAVAQLRSGNLQGNVTAFINPIDYANMVLTKAISQGQYMQSLAELGATIVEDNNIPVGYVQVAILDYYKVLIYKGFSVSFGWENDDFTKNLVTAVGEMRIHQFFSENHTGAFIYDTLDNIKTAITAAP